MLSTAMEDSNIWRHDQHHDAQKRGNTLVILGMDLIIRSRVRSRPRLVSRQGVLTLKALYHICGLLSQRGKRQVSVERRKHSEFDGLLLEVAHASFAQQGWLFENDGGPTAQKHI